jgi:hypothetical protein
LQIASERRYALPRPTAVPGNSLLFTGSYTLSVTKILLKR